MPHPAAATLAGMRPVTGTRRVGPGRRLLWLAVAAVVRYAAYSGRVAASGLRADLSAALPLLS